MGQVQQRLRTLPDHSLAISCFDYTDMRNVTFFQTRDVCPSWERPTMRGVRTSLTIEHMLASCAVPLIFPPVLMDGHYYGDGSLRNMTPSTPPSAWARSASSSSACAAIPTSGRPTWPPPWAASPPPCSTPCSWTRWISTPSS